jgi:hypothetical protein
MKRYAHFFLLAGLFAAGCQRQAGPTAEETGSVDRAGAARDGTVEVPAHTQFYVRVDKTLDSSKVKQGDSVRGTLDSSIVADGREVLPRGTDLGIRITNTQVASAPGSVGLLTLDIETVRHDGKEYAIDVDPVTLQTSPVDRTVNPDRQLPNLPLTEGQARANAVLDTDRAILFVLNHPLHIKP